MWRENTERITPNCEEDEKNSYRLDDRSDEDDEVICYF
jgi:hypothetical protein